MINNHYVLQRTTGGYAMAEPAIKKAINVLDYLNRDIDTKELYEIREKALKDETSMINGAKLEGKLEGRLETAMNMYAAGEPEEKIKKYTGITDEEIEKFKNAVKNK